MKNPDSTISQLVSRVLSSRGMRPPCHIAVATLKGNVTLSGAIQYEHQRRIAVQAARGVAGVQRVVDHLTIIPRVQHWK
jgi:osmotically-inducible protein OsmY